jgi:hypothetical protein
MRTSLVSREEPAGLCVAGNSADVRGAGDIADLCRAGFLRPSFDRFIPRHTRISLATACLCLFGSLLSGPAAAVEWQDLVDVVQMPVAVDRAIEIGLSDEQVRNIARILIERGESGKVFNETIRASIEGLSASTQEPDIGQFVVDRVRGGLRGQDLAAAIHARLNQRGIPAGRWRAVGPPPVARDFISDHARNRMTGKGRHRPVPPGHASPSEQMVEARRHLPAAAAERPERRLADAVDEARGRAPNPAQRGIAAGPPDDAPRDHRREQAGSPGGRP